MTPREWVIERFLAKVNKTDGCWLWTGCTSSGNLGYGVFRALGEQYAHRVSWVLENGEIPQGMFVCHRCDVPRCVRPDHLFLGTALDNNQDSLRKGRRAPTARAEFCAHGHSKADAVRKRDGWNCRVCAKVHAERFRARRAANRA